MTILFIVGKDESIVRIAYAASAERLMRVMQHYNFQRLKVVREVNDTLAHCVWMQQYFGSYHLERGWFQFHPEMPSLTKATAKPIATLIQVDTPEVRLLPVGRKKKPRPTKENADSFFKSAYPSHMLVSNIAHPLLSSGVPDTIPMRSDKAPARKAKLADKTEAYDGVDAMFRRITWENR